MHDIHVSIEVIDINENNMSLLGEEQSMIMWLLKDREPIDNNDGVWE
jgi:hypothetical protein